MGKFCTGCGSQLEDGVRFCEQCGKPQAIPAGGGLTAGPATTTPSVAPPLRAPSRKTIVILGSAVALLGVAAGGIYWALRDPEPPTAAEVTAQIKGNSALLASLTCLDNFDYSADPVRINAYDGQTQRWMSALVESGLYNGPEEVVSGGGWYPQRQLQYTQTDHGKASIKGKTLCFAPGIVIDQVSYAPEDTAQVPRRVAGQADYHYEQLATWAGSPAIKSQTQRLSSDKLSLPVAFELQDGKWKSIAPGSIHASTQQRNLEAKSEAPHGGLLAWFGNLFGGSPGAAIQGRWLVGGGIIPMVFEFRPESAVIMGQELQVTYETDGDLIKVRATKGTNRSETLQVKVISSNELSLISEAGEILRLTRAN